MRIKGKSAHPYPTKGGKTNRYAGYLGGGQKGGGEGKGYQGNCWHCGKVGHKAAECAVRVQEVGETSEKAKVGQVAVGIVWHIGCVGLSEGLAGLEPRRVKEESKFIVVKSRCRKR